MTLLSHKPYALNVTLQQQDQVGLDFRGTRSHLAVAPGDVTLSPPLPAHPHSNSSVRQELQFLARIASRGQLVIAVHNRTPQLAAHVASVITGLAAILFPKEHTL